MASNEKRIKREIEKSYQVSKSYNTGTLVVIFPWDLRKHKNIIEDWGIITANIGLNKCKRRREDDRYLKYKEKGRGRFGDRIKIGVLEN